MDVVSGHRHLRPLWVYLRSRLYEPWRRLNFEHYDSCQQWANLIHVFARFACKIAAKQSVCSKVLSAFPVQFWQRCDQCFTICVKKWILTKTLVIVCLPTNIKSADTASPLCTITYSVCTEPGSCCGMQYALLTSRHYTACQNWSHTLSHKIMHNTACCAHYVMMTCTASVYSAISTFLSRNFTLTLVSLDLPPRSCTIVYRQPLPSVYLELRQCNITAKGNALGWYTCSAGCMSSTVIPGLALAHDNQHEVQAGLTRSYLDWMYTQVCMCWNTFCKLAVHCIFTEQYLR